MPRTLRPSFSESVLLVILTTGGVAVAAHLWAFIRYGTAPLQLVGWADEMLLGAAMLCVVAALALAQRRPTRGHLEIIGWGLLLVGLVVSRDLPAEVAVAGSTGAVVMLARAVLAAGWTLLRVDAARPALVLAVVAGVTLTGLYADHRAALAWRLDGDPDLAPAMRVLREEGLARAQLTLADRVTAVGGLLPRSRDLARALGAAAYERQPAPSERLSECSEIIFGGCAQGVLYAFEHHRGRLEPEITRLCREDELDAGAAMRCAGSLGHGLFALRGPDLGVPLGACDVLAHGLRPLCYVGVISAHQNELLVWRLGDPEARAQALAPHLRFRADDLREPCRALGAVHQPFCYDVHAGTLLLLGHEPAAVTALCARLEGPGAIGCHVGLGRSSLGPSRSFDTAARACAAARDTGRRYCFDGALTGYGADTRAMAAWCGTLAGVDRPYCAGALGLRAAALHGRDETARREACSALAVDLRSSCLAALSSSPPAGAPPGITGSPSGASGTPPR